MSQYNVSWLSPLQELLNYSLCNPQNKHLIEFNSMAPQGMTSFLGAIENASKKSTWFSFMPQNWKWGGKAALLASPTTAFHIFVSNLRERQLISDLVHAEVGVDEQKCASQQPLNRVWETIYTCPELPAVERNYKGSF